MKFMEKFQKCMYGRYGVDDLYKFLMYSYILLVIINLFIKSNILSIIELVIFFIMFYRFFSKNIYKRSNENIRFLKFKGNLLKPFYILKRNYRDRHKCIYKKCKFCKKLLKLPIPYSRGFKEVKCPKCKKVFKILVLRKEKIEIIAKK